MRQKKSLKLDNTPSRSFKLFHRSSYFQNFAIALARRGFTPNEETMPFIISGFAEEDDKHYLGGLKEEKSKRKKRVDLQKVPCFIFSYLPTPLPFLGKY